MFGDDGRQGDIPGTGWKSGCALALVGDADAFLRRRRREVAVVVATSHAEPTTPPIEGDKRCEDDARDDELGLFRFGNTETVEVQYLIGAVRREAHLAISKYRYGDQHVALPTTLEERL